MYFQFGRWKKIFRHIRNARCRGFPCIVFCIFLFYTYEYSALVLSFCRQMRRRVINRGPVVGTPLDKTRRHKHREDAVKPCRLTFRGPAKSIRWASKTIGHLSLGINEGNVEVFFFLISTSYLIISITIVRGGG